MLLQSEQTVCSSLVPRINAEMYVVCIYMATACNDIAQLNDDPSHSVLYVLSRPVLSPTRPSISLSSMQSNCVPLMDICWTNQREFMY